MIRSMMISTGVKKKKTIKKTSLQYLLTTTIMLRTTVHQLFYLLLPSFPHRSAFFLVASLPFLHSPLNFLSFSLLSPPTFSHSFRCGLEGQAGQPTHPANPPTGTIDMEKRGRKKEFLFVCGEQNRSRYAYLDIWTRMAVAWQFLEKDEKKKEKKRLLVFLLAGCLDRLVMLGLVAWGLFMVVVVCLFFCSIVVAFC
ncbi:hypothetical protein B9Z19DRAFT_1074355 [Tuber borchii]|uniref:Transmembrane protein n=1 Tax=Tuber borchii TaxID=42251 RepID=A0A2T7A4T3_TUBBO|nr:hypothetical protein B9Z19DRAFT_1074355 [Tuber borchii]